MRDQVFDRLIGHLIDTLISLSLTREPLNFASSSSSYAKLTSGPTAPRFSYYAACAHILQQYCTIHSSATWQWACTAYSTLNIRVLRQRAVASSGIEYVDNGMLQCTCCCNTIPSLISSDHPFTNHIIDRRVVI